MGEQSHQYRGEKKRWGKINLARIILVQYIIRLQLWLAEQLCGGKVHRPNNPKVLTPQIKIFWLLKCFIALICYASANKHIFVKIKTWKKTDFASNTKIRLTMFMVMVIMMMMVMMVIMFMPWVVFVWSFRINNTLNPGKVRSKSK